MSGPSTNGAPNGGPPDGPWRKYAPGGLPPRVTVADIQRRLGPPPSQFAADLNTRSRATLGDLNSVIAGVKADPRNLLNAPRVLDAVARYVPNAFGLVPAASVDQVTGPIVRGINARFGAHYDPHYATDQILNAAGVLAGARPELPPAGTPAEIAAWRESALNPEPAVSPDVAANARLKAIPPTVRVIPDTLYAAQTRVQNARIATLPLTVQRHFLLNARDVVDNPIYENPDFAGYRGKEVADLRTTLANLSDHYRPQGAEGSMLADEIDHLNDNFTAMAGRQPAFARALGASDPAGGADAPNLVDLTRDSEMDAGRLAKLLGGGKAAPPPIPAPARGEFQAANDNDRNPDGVIRLSDYRPASPYQLIFPSGETVAPTQAARDMVSTANDNDPGHADVLTAPAGAPTTYADQGLKPPTREDRFIQEFGEDTFAKYNSLSPQDKQTFLNLIQNLVPKDSDAPLPDNVVAMPQRPAGGAAAPGPDARVGLNLPNAFSSGMDLASAIASRVADAGQDLGFGDLGANVILPLSIAASPSPRFPPQGLPGQQTRAPGAATPTTPSW